MNTKEKVVPKFSFKDELGYICGDMAGSFVNLFIDSFYLTFCTYVLGIEASWMAGLFLCSRLFDAINDPIIGSFPDRWTLGKSGNKFKPWIKLFMIPLGLSGVLCFLNVPFEGIMLHVWVAAVYILYGMCYTGTSMPFGAMANVVTNDPIERSKLSRARSIGGAFVGIVAISVVPVVCYKDSQILPERFTLMGLIFGICCIVFYMLLCTLTHERIHVEKQEGEKFDFGKVIKAAFTNRPLVGVMVATIGSMLTITGSAQLNTYIYKEVYHNTDVMTIASIATIPIMLIALPLVPKLVAKFGKKKIIIAGAASGLIFSLIKVFVYIENVYVFLALYLLMMVGQTAFSMLIWAMVSDCLDYNEWKNNFRSDGSMYSLYTFSRKIGSTIASTGAAASLSMIGYVSGLNVVQSEATVTGIYYLVNMIPVLTCLFELIGVGLIFNLDQKTTAQMYAELADRREAHN